MPDKNISLRILIRIGLPSGGQSILPNLAKADKCQTYASVTPYVTRNGSEIRELMHPTVQGNKNQSLEKATISVGAKTLRHKHLVTEELNQMIDGHGLMHLGDQTFDVFAGDTI